MMGPGLGPLLARRARPPSALKADLQASRCSPRSKVDLRRNTGAAVGGRWRGSLKRNGGAPNGGGTQQRCLVVREEGACACDEKPCTELPHECNAWVAGKMAWGWARAAVGNGWMRPQSTGSVDLRQARGGGRPWLHHAKSEQSVPWASVSAFRGVVEQCLIRAGRFRVPLAGRASAGVDTGGAIAQLLRLHGSAASGEHGAGQGTPRGPVWEQASRQPWEHASRALIAGWNIRALVAPKDGSPLQQVVGARELAGLVRAVSRDVESSRVEASAERHLAGRLAAAAAASVARASRPELAPLLGAARGRLHRCPDIASASAHARSGASADAGWGSLLNQ
ncbi:hypothetical protein PSPO01_05640 [Paraphaeosphaeria sporulosa]